MSFILFFIIQRMSLLLEGLIQFLFQSFVRHFLILRNGQTDSTLFDNCYALICTVIIATDGDIGVPSIPFFSLNTDFGR